MKRESKQEQESVVRMLWTKEEGRLVSRWREIAEPTRYSPAWMQLHSSDTPIAETAPHSPPPESWEPLFAPVEAA